MLLNVDQIKRSLASKISTQNSLIDNVNKIFWPNFSFIKVKSNNKICFAH